MEKKRSDIVEKFFMSYNIQPRDIVENYDEKDFIKDKLSLKKEELFEKFNKEQYKKHKEFEKLKLWISEYDCGSYNVFYRGLGKFQYRDAGIVGDILSELDEFHENDSYDNREYYMEKFVNIITIMHARNLFDEYAALLRSMLKYRILIEERKSHITKGEFVKIYADMRKKSMEMLSLFNSTIMNNLVSNTYALNHKFEDLDFNKYIIYTFRRLGSKKLSELIYHENNWFKIQNIMMSSLDT